ncbi:hypothetical protein ACQB60_22515 [Actinomycetota bacterium Odt1-20B]
MHIRLVDPRDTTWEQDHAAYRVYFWEGGSEGESRTSYEYEVLDEVDVEELLTWAKEYAAERGWTYTVYVWVAGGVVGDGKGGSGLIRLAGIHPSR